MASAERDDDPERPIRREWTVEEILDVIDEDGPRSLLDHREIPYVLAEWRWSDDYRDNVKYDTIEGEINFRSEDTPSREIWDRVLENAQDERETKDDAQTADEDLTGDKPPDPDVNVTWSMVADEFEAVMDTRERKAAEMIATVYVRMLFTDVTDCPVSILKGQASTQKSTVVNTFNGINITQRHGDVTPRSFVSHMNNEGQDEDVNDILPELKQEIMSITELNPWFNGEEVDEFMAILSDVLDGDGHVRATGAQGRRGYVADYPGEYRFGIVGAVTHLSRSAWVALGDAGSRFLFYPMERVDDSELEQLRKSVNEGEYSKKVERMTEKVTQWWRTFYHEHNGEITPEERPRIPEDVDRTIMLLANLLARGRAKDYGGEDADTVVDTAEEPTRIFAMYQRIARAHGLLYEEETVGEPQMELLARITFGSMPSRRVGPLKMLLRPSTGWKQAFKSKEVDAELGVQRGTATRRMKELGRLGLANVSEQERDDGRGTEWVIELNDFRYNAIFDEEKVNRYNERSSDDKSELVYVPWPYDG